MEGVQIKDTKQRDKIIARTSALGIAVNILVASAKVIVGVLASSIAIISEGVNNAADVLTSVLTLVGTKLAGKHPDKKHPFGYGRVEYLTSMAIAVMILISGGEMLMDSIKLVRDPQELNISYLSLAVVAGSAIVKFILGLHTIRMGKKAESGALEAVGIDCRNDSFVSIVTIISAVVFLVFGLSIDAYVGIFTSLMIVKTGFDVLKGTVSDLLGKAGETELAAQIYKEIRSCDIVINAADMMLHDYGPDRYSGSVNVEIDHDCVVGDVYQVLHELQLRIMREYNVVMVFGIYAVDDDHEESKELRAAIADFVGNQQHVSSFHAVYVEPGSGSIYCDLVVDYALRDWDALREQFTAYMNERYPENELILTIETEYV